MDTVTFLRSVWPSEGYYLIALFHRKGERTWWEQESFTDVEAAARFALARGKTQDAYFAIHSLRKPKVWDPEKKRGDKVGGWTYRTHANMLASRTFFGDGDVGSDKPYTTLAEVVLGLKAFCLKTGLPKPTMVKSGRGLHIYWRLTRALPSLIWREHAVKLKQLCASAGFHLDPSRITDQASVLRVPGTFHLKDPANPLPVAVLHDGGEVDTDEFLALLDRGTLFAPRPGEFAKGEVPEGWGGAPPPFVDLGHACGLVRYAVRNPHEISEPQWYQLLGLVRHVQEGPLWCHRMSKGHPGYNAAETDAKLHQLAIAAGGKLGPTTCAKMADVFGGKTCAACWYKGHPTSSPIVGARRLPPDERAAIPGAGIVLTDLWALAQMDRFFCLPTGQHWPRSGVNGKFQPVNLGTDDKGKPVTVAAAVWLYRNQSADGLTWWPGLPPIIQDRISFEGVLVERSGAKLINRYRPPLVLTNGDPAKVSPWLDHGRKLYGPEFDHIVACLAFKARHPGEKVNHAVVLGGGQGIGKDTLLHPVLQAIGPWNSKDIKPDQLFGQFTPFYQAVILVISEVNDLGDKDRHRFYERTKTLIAAPPPTLTVNEKFLTSYDIPNCCFVVMTTNHKAGGIYLPPDDRRHFVAASSLVKDDFEPGYFDALWTWMNREGCAHVQAYLAGYDLSGFDPKAPPPRTPAWHEIVSAGRAPEEAELAGVVEAMGNPEALTVKQVRAAATLDTGSDIAVWLADRRNRRTIPYRLERVGYTVVRNDDAKDGDWRVGGAPTAIYAKADLSEAARQRAAAALAATSTK